MASPILWTWVWVDSGSWWCTGKLGVLQYMGMQTDTCLSWTENLKYIQISCILIIWWLLNSMHFSILAELWLKRWITNYEVTFYIKMENKKHYYIEHQTIGRCNRRQDRRYNRSKKKNLKKVKSSKKHTRSMCT